MASKASEGVIAKTYFGVLFCIMIAVYVYILVIHGWLSCFDLGSRWDILEATEFYIHVIVIAAWISYKESSFVLATIITITSTVFGSFVTVGYILVQFYKLSPEETLKDPLYHVLVRHHKREKTWRSSVILARVIFSVLGCLMLGVLLYTIITDLSSSYARGFTPCLLTFMTDIYIHTMILSAWIAYKEPHWISAFFWILSLLCFRSIAECVYIVRQLFYLSPEQPAFLILFNKNNRDLESSDPLLMTHPDV